MVADQAQAGVAERILETAIDEFSAHGFAGARVDRIASNAKVSPRSLYYHFGNKRDLYVAVYRQLQSEHFTDFLQHVSTDDLAGLLLANLDRAASPRWRRWARLSMWEALQPTGVGAHEYDSVNGDLVAFRRAQEEGRLDPSLDPHLLALAFTAITFFPWMVPGEVIRTVGLEPSDPEFVDRQTRLVTDLVARLQAAVDRPDAAHRTSTG
ncbi:TetR/AcrR family transcriptional regulator [Pseudonocardia lacus]|uniref:TetR/AcrR family transcriptional regulator n=1 Tax=Pseudonocardia lacus TaxID=2835865 RepID=UPI001BDBD0C7|nr:TetR/AcrR family transcriptional regulator [Pseudonocardia lacus]